MFLLRTPGRRVSSRARGAALAALSLVGLSLAAAPGLAAAAAPTLAITSPTPASATNNQTPLFQGVIEQPEESDLYGEVIATVHAGNSLAGPVVEEPRTSSWLFPGPTTWFAEGNEPLSDGTYTVQASQPELETPSEPVTFRIDTSAPQVSIGVPAAGTAVSGGALTVHGSAGTLEGDLAGVTVQVYSGQAVEGTPLEAVEVQSHEGTWTGTLAGLAPGSYTLLAEQTDSAGNVGLSPTAALTVQASPSPPPPAAAFRWFPSSPVAGETVSLVSTSTDAEIALTGYAWTLDGSEPFRPGGPVLSTTFTKAGPHVVRLQVTDAAGRSSVAAETISVRHRATSLMQPFPIVRIAGRETKAGVRLSLLTVAAPVGSKVTVRIRGMSARPSAASRQASAGRHSPAGGTVLLSFPRFERSLAAGAVLEISVTKPDQIGKLTRFVSRRGRLPSRMDTCLTPTGVPLRCPSS